MRHFPCIFRILILDYCLKEAISLRAVIEKMHTSFTLPIIFWISGRPQQELITRLRMCPAKWMYTAFGARQRICACTATPSRLMAAALSYPWPRQSVMGMLRSLKHSRIEFEIAAPVVRARLLKSVNSSRISLLLLTKRMTMASISLL